MYVEIENLKMILCCGIQNNENLRDSEISSYVEISLPCEISCQMFESNEIARQTFEYLQSVQNPWLLRKIDLLHRLIVVTGEVGTKVSYPQSHYVLSPIFNR